MFKSLPDLRCLPSKQKLSRHQLLEENQTLKDLVGDLQNRTDNANAHCERLKIAVDTIAKQNLQLNNNLKQSQLSTDEIKEIVNDLSVRNSELATLNQTLRQTRVKLETEGDRLSSLEGEVGRLQEQLKTFDEITTAFTKKVVDIEEGLFKCYYEYRAENRALHHNNLLHIFLQFDQDRDGVLNYVEFARFNEYINSIYGQKIEWSGANFTTHDLTNTKISSKA